MAKRRGRRGATPPPKCKAILLCEKAIIDAVTGSPSIISVFDGFTVPHVPSKTSPFTAFLHLTDGIANHEYKITVEIHDLSNGTVIARTSGPAIRWGDRFGRINLVIPVPPLPVKHVGDYDFVVYANDQEIDRQKFGVIIRLPPEPTTQE